MLCRVFGTSMVEEYEEIADSQYPSERLEYLDEDYGKMLTLISNAQITNFKFVCKRPEMDVLTLNEFILYFHHCANQCHKSIGYTRLKKPKYIILQSSYQIHYFDFLPLFSN